MPMALFSLLFPDVAQRETRTVTFSQDVEGIAAGTYGLLESYCDEPGCDCRRVFINVARADPPGIVATIGFGWESEEFYRRRFKSGPPESAKFMAGAHLESFVRQSAVAPLFLGIFNDMIRRDPAYVDRIARHYRMYKAEVERRAGPDAAEPDDPVALMVRARDGLHELARMARDPGRNAPCACGSGRKSKRCCGRQAV